MSMPRLCQLVAIALLSVLVATARGQSPSRPTLSDGLAFEAASIKQNKSAAARRNFGMEPGGRFVMANDSIRQILAMAYAETPEIRGLPDWVLRERYDINATAGRDTTRDEMVAMLRKLLADRLHFRAHVENTKQEAYALTLASSKGTLGPRVQKSPVDCPALTAALAVNDAALADSLRGTYPTACTQRVMTGRIESHGMTMTQLAGTIRGPVGRPVVDQTGINGSFDFVLEFAADITPSDQRKADAPPGIFTALQEQLGLVVVPTHVTVPTLVVDQIDRPDPD